MYVVFFVKQKTAYEMRISDWSSDVGAADLSLPPPASSLARDTVEWSKSLTDPASRLSWDDLRVIRAIGKTGALATGAELLGINTSTIARRLSKMEEVLGATLFDRRRTGYVATVQGEELIALAERVELDV